MKKTKIIAAALAAGMSLSAIPAFAADTTIAPATAIMNSNIGELNQMTNIWAYSFGSGDGGADKIISPINYVDGLDANVANIITNIVSVDCNIDLSDISGMVESMRADMMNNMLWK